MIIWKKTRIKQILSPRKRKKHTHKQPLGGQTKFQAEYGVKFKADTIERGKKDGQFACRACGNDYNLGKKGEINIQSHISTAKHQKSLADFNKNLPIANFIKTKKVYNIFF
jgi:hypothetical protein